MGIIIGGNTLDSTSVTLEGSVMKRTLRKVTAAMIDSYEANNFTITSSGNDANGFYSISGYNTTGGCGGAEGGIWVKILNSIPWTYVFCTFTMGGTAACWGFMGNNGYGGLSNASGNLQAYSSTSDFIFSLDSTNAFEKSQFTTKLSACDNNSDNFFHPSFQTGDPKIITVSARRNSNGTIAGPVHGRSCNSTGTGAYTTISNIYIL